MLDDTQFDSLLRPPKSPLVNGTGVVAELDQDQYRHEREVVGWYPLSSVDPYTSDLFARVSELALAASTHRKESDETELGLIRLGSVHD
jgi:hypothetical protein